MATSKTGTAAHARSADTTQAVDAFMAALEHPRKADLEALRALVLAVDPSIAEGIKWNAPSFRTTEYFATTNLRGATGLRMILHLGAKARAMPPGGLVIDDPEGLLKWLAKDRAMIEFRDGGDLRARQTALRQLLGQWISYV